MSLGTHEPEILGPRQPVIPRLLDGPLLRAADPVHGHVQMFGHVELVEDDLSRCPIERGLSRLDIGLPHIHRDGLTPPRCFGVSVPKKPSQLSCFRSSAR